MKREAATRRKKEAKGWLESWLDLTRYGDVDDLTLYQWGMQFSARARALAHWRATATVGPASLDQLIQAPLQFGMRGFKLTDRRPIEEIGHLDIDKLTRLIGQFPAAIADWDARYASHSVETRALNGLAGAGFQVQPTLLAAVCESNSKHAPTEHAPTDLPGLKEYLEIGFVGVDFRYSNNTLCAQFEAYLTRTRKLLSDAGVQTTSPEHVTARAEKFTSDVLNQWIRLKVLPYIDIMLVAKARGRPMPTNEVIGEALFPGSDIDVEAKVKKEVSPRANKLLLQENYERMLLEGQQVPGPLMVFDGEAPGQQIVLEMT